MLTKHESLTPLVGHQDHDLAAGPDVRGVAIVSEPTPGQVELAQIELAVDLQTPGPLTYVQDIEVDSTPKKSSDEFLVGTAISTWQNSGDPDNSRPDSNWGEFAHGSHFGCIPHIRGGKKACGCYYECGRGPGPGPDFWNRSQITVCPRYEEDIQAAKAIGCNSFRFSLEWSRIEPRKGEIDQEALHRFADIFDCIIENGMEPLPTFYHFVYPLWFLRLGGFAKRENIAHFVSFCKLTFDTYKQKAKLWATINEPNVRHLIICKHMSLSSFIKGRLAKSPAGVMVDTNRSRVGLLDLLGGLDAQIGIVHNYMWFESAGKSPLYWFTRYLATRVNHWYGNDLFMEFFTTGRYKWEKFSLVGFAAWLTDQQTCGAPARHCRFFADMSSTRSRTCPRWIGWGLITTPRACTTHFSSQPAGRGST
eukprot:scaffold259022_cov34-Prasinocladus_malaysianus.AAC.2